MCHRKNQILKVCINSCNKIKVTCGMSSFCDIPVFPSDINNAQSRFQLLLYIILTCNVDANSVKAFTCDIVLGSSFGTSFNFFLLDILLAHKLQSRRILRQSFFFFIHMNIPSFLTSQARYLHSNLAFINLTICSCIWISCTCFMCMYITQI